MAAPSVITLADGEQRPVVRTWPDGAWECPFCFYPHTGPSCGNPACLAFPGITAGRVAAVKAEWAARDAENARRVRLAALDEARRLEREQRRLATVAEFLAQAETKGWCPRCWRHSTSNGSYPDSAKLVRHRDPENCPHRKRDLARQDRS